MAETRLSDLVIPEIFTPLAIKRSLELSAVFNSGLVAIHPEFQAFLQAAYGKLVHMPFFNDLGDDEANVGSDDPASLSTPKKVTETDQRAVKQFRNQSWSSMDLTAAVASRDPMAVIVERVGAYWARQFDRYGVATLVGILADNEANDAGDMLNSVYADAAPTAGSKISAEAIIDARHTAGDLADQFNILIIHSNQYNTLQKLNLIDFIPDARGEILFPTYLGMRLIVSDQVNSTGGTTATAYDAILSVPGSIMYGESSPRTPTEVDRKPDAGDGEGQEVLHNRRHFGMHVDGMDWLSAAMTGESPTIAEMKNAANWNRVVERKQIQIAFLRTNGETVGQ